MRQIYVRQEKFKKAETRSKCLGREETQEASQEKSCGSKRTATFRPDQTQ